MKHALRKELRGRAREMDGDSREELSEIVMARVEALPQFRAARVVAAYWSTGGEVATHGWVEKWVAEKTVLLPVVAGEELVLRRFTSVAEMAKGGFCIAEPQGEEYTDYESIDLLIVPGVGFDLRCGRLGRGKGYYDRLLKMVRGMKVGVCFDWQLVEEVPIDGHDVMMDVVVTEKRIVAVKGDNLKYRRI